MGHGVFAFPNRELVHHAYSQVLSIEIVVQGLQMSVTVFRLRIVLLMNCRIWSVVKDRCHFLWRMFGSSRL